jgi:hypothetical protein
VLLDDEFCVKDTMSLLRFLSIFFWPNDSRVSAILKFNFSLVCLLELQEESD